MYEDVVKKHMAKELARYWAGYRVYYPQIFAKYNWITDGMNEIMHEWVEIGYLDFSPKEQIFIITRKGEKYFKYLIW